VRTGGQQYQGIAAKLTRAATTLRAMAAGSTSGSQSVAALLENRDELTTQVETAATRYQTAGDALVDYSYALDRVQATTSQALARARSAQWDVAENTRLANLYARLAEQADTPEQAEQRVRYLRQESNRWDDVADGRTRVTSERQVVDQAVVDRDQAAQAASDRISQITSNDGLNDSWWDNWGAKVVAWITDVAEWISTIAGILALLVCWIPVIGQALAGVLLIIAAVSAIVAALGNIALAATGERSWGEAVMSIVGAVLSCVGLKGAALAGKAAFNTIMKTGVKLSLGQTADRLSIVLMRGLMRPGALGRIAAGKTGSLIKGRIGEEIINVISTTAKRRFPVYDPVTKGARLGEPDGAIRVFGRWLFGESKNLGWNTVKPGILGATKQMREYIDLVCREGDGVLRLFVNMETDVSPLLGAIGDLVKIPNGRVIVTRYENVLGVKLNAWLQATLGTGAKVPGLGG
jgi:hypothetical protein